MIWLVWLWGLTSLSISSPQVLASMDFPVVRTRRQGELMRGRSQKKTSLGLKMSWWVRGLCVCVCDCLMVVGVCSLIGGWQGGNCAVGLGNHSITVYQGIKISGIIQFCKNIDFAIQLDIIHFLFLHVFYPSFEAGYIHH